MEDKRNAYRILVVKPEGNRLFGRPAYIRDDNMKTRFQRNEFEGVEWFHVTHDKDLWYVLVNTIMNLPISQNRGFYDYLSDY